MKIESVLSRYGISCILVIFSNNFEKTFKTLIGWKFFSTVLFSSPLSRGLNAARYRLPGNLQFRMLLLMASVKGTVSSSADKT